MSEFAGLPAVKPEEVGLASDRLDRITLTMERAVEAAQVPGVATVIVAMSSSAYRSWPPWPFHRSPSLRMRSSPRCPSRGSTPCSGATSARRT